MERATEFEPGQGVSWNAGAYRDSGTVSRVTPGAIYVVEDIATLKNGAGTDEPDKLHFEPGGFVGHTSGTQRYEYAPGNGPELKFTRRPKLGGAFKLSGASTRGSMRAWGILQPGRGTHYDFNF